MTAHERALKTAELLILTAGAVCLAASIAADQAWLDRHFLPSFLISRRWYLGIETSARMAVGALGTVLMWSRRRLAERAFGAALPLLGCMAAAVLALDSAELALPRAHLRPAEWRVLNEEPRRQPDEEIGWTFVPGRTSYNTRGGRRIEYAFDASGYRVRDVNRPVDPRRPSLLFAGESVMFGDGLTFDESIPANVESILGVQSVNLAVYGYSTDQIYLRLRRELPRFSRPVAVVALFMTTLFGRNLDDDRPHLGRDLRWLPAEEHGRLAALAGLFFPFRRDRTIDAGAQITRNALGAIRDVTRNRGAVPLVLVPHFGDESEPERTLRMRILDAGHIPYLLVRLDPAWHIKWDHHPDGRAALMMAHAVASALKPLIATHLVEDSP